MPPRKRPASSESPSYDGVPTVNVTVGTEPEPAETDAAPELGVVVVPAADDAPDTGDDGEE